MVIEQNLYTGGDGSIILTKNDNIQAEDSVQDSVNDLIINCKASKDALCALYNMFKKSVFAVAFSITCDYHLSEDCVAETFIRLTQVKKFSSKDGDGRGFILAIARNVALEMRRRYKRECVSFVIQSYGEADKTVEDSIYINQLLKHLNDKQRQIVILKCCSQLTYKEIASLLKCPETTVKSRYKKAMGILHSKAGDGNE